MKQTTKRNENKKELLCVIKSHEIKRKANNIERTHRHGEAGHSARVMERIGSERDG